MFEDWPLCSIKCNSFVCEWVTINLTFIVTLWEEPMLDPNSPTVIAGNSFARLWVPKLTRGSNCFPHAKKHSNQFSYLYSLIIDSFTPLSTRCTKALYVLQSIKVFYISKCVIFKFSGALQPHSNVQNDFFRLCTFEIAATDRSTPLVKANFKIYKFLENGSEHNKKFTNKQIN